MKKLLFVVAFAAAAVSVKAQDESDVQGFKFGAGATLAIPVSNMAGTSIGAGIDLMGRYGLSENFAITADAGYTALFGKDNAGTVNLIPIRAGIRFYPSSQFYIGAKGGVGILSVKGGGGSTTTTAYAFGAGYQFDPSFDVSADYQGYSKNGSFGYIGVRLGYTF